MLKPVRFRSDKYLAWVRRQPCALCGAHESGHAHHIKGIGYLSGAGMKAPDQYTMPLCPECHETMHRDPSLREHQWEMIARTLGRAIAEGILRIAA